MTTRRVAAFAAIALLVAALAWVLFIGLPRWYAPQQVESGPVSKAPPSPEAARKITATLYFISEDGLSLEGAQREVPFGDPVVEQARHIIEAQLGAAPAPLAAAVPQGTALRGLYVSDKGDAFIDLSTEARANHPGGALSELFTVYALVDALTVNLPAIARVQILIEGKEVDTLAGHVDLRHPLQKNLKWIRTAEDAEKE
jgi:spore germination protein GerM